MIKKAISLFLIVAYLFTSSTLVHSFCAMEHVEAVESQVDHWCCDEGDTENKDCLDKCLSSFSEAKSPDSKITEEKVFNNIEYLVKPEINQNTFPEITRKKKLIKISFNPPRQWNYIWITKKVE